MLFANGTVALITGGSRGIGRAVALDLAAEGATVVVNHSRSAEDAEQTAVAVRAKGGTAYVVAADVSDERAVRDMFVMLRQEFGRLDVLVTSAGITADGFVAGMSLSDFEQVMRVNMTGVFLCCREAARLMMRERKGAIVTLSSTTSDGSPGAANYAASKGAIVAFTRSVAAELAPYHVRANVVSPGLVDTGMTRRMRAEVRAMLNEHILLERAGKPEEVARAVSFLASDNASYITGACIDVDGGLSLPVHLPPSRLLSGERTRRRRISASRSGTSAVSGRPDVRDGVDGHRI